MRILLYVLCQCTWGALQTALGLIVFLVHVKDRHSFYHGAIVTRWQMRSSAALGPFVFLAKGDSADEHPGSLLVHEYGHTIQSLILGPLFLPVIGIPSLLWAGLPYCKKKRAEKQISYFSFYTESWANLLGGRIAHRRK